MNFFIEQKHGIKQNSLIVWDADNNKEICVFVDGEFETEDESIIKKLIDLGYEYEDQPNVDINESLDIPENENEIRSKAKELGIKSWHLKNIETLTNEIKEKEGVY